MITGDRPSKCELADECRFDPNCPVWLACVAIEGHERNEPPPHLPEDVPVKREVL